MKIDSEFIKYFRRRYPWTTDVPVHNFPWYILELKAWNECKKAYGIKEK